MDLMFVSTRKGGKELSDGGRKGMATVVAEAWLAPSWARQRPSAAPCLSGNHRKATVILATTIAVRNEDYRK